MSLIPSLGRKHIQSIKIEMAHPWFPVWLFESYNSKAGKSFRECLIMAGGGNISRSLCALKNVFDIISLYLEKSKRDFTSLCFGMESQKKPWLVGIFIHESYHGEGNQNWGRETWGICIYQKEAGITEVWQTLIYFQPFICIHMGKLRPRGTKRCVQGDTACRQQRQDLWPPD